MDSNAPPIPLDASDSSPAGRAVVERRPLLPAAFSRPLILWWVAVLPQAILLLLNLRGYATVSGDMSSSQTAAAMKLFAFELVLLGLCASVAFLGFRFQRKLSVPVCLGLLVAHGAFLWFSTGLVTSAIPQAASLWILPTERVVMHQFTFMMPVIFYALMRVSCFHWPISRGADVGLSILAAVGAPLVFTVLGQADFFHSIFSGALMMITLFGGAALMIAALTRLLVMAFTAALGNQPTGLMVLTFFVAIAGPLGGLALNHNFPFPANFQSLGVYLMTVANGAVLMVPNLKAAGARRFVWLLQCAFFPFTLYFFIVFLPFLPLSVLAVIGMGTGFLMLTPTALFVLHGQRLWHGFATEAPGLGRSKAAVLALVAVALMPTGYAIKAQHDRTVIHGALDYVYSPDYRAEQRFDGNLGVLKGTLENLSDFKAGIYLPYVSGYYNWHVFGGLVLPEHKMQHMHQAFFGEDMAKPKPALSVFGGQPRRSNWVSETRRVATPPPRDVALTAVRPTHSIEDGCTRTVLEVEMVNQAEAQSEFVATIRIPEGVFVSGFSLWVGDERVPGRLFEKKSAMWVYQQIRDVTRADPGTLVYQDPRTVEFRVFPFRGHETRKAEIELLYPRSLGPVVKFGNRTLDFSARAADAKTGIALAANTAEDSGAAALVFSRGALGDLPVASRTPYLHFIVDRSAESPFAGKRVVESIQGIAAALDVEDLDAVVTFANYETVTDHPEPASLAEVVGRLEASELPLQSRGGFLGRRALKEALLRYQDDLDKPASTALSRYPVFVVLGGESLDADDDDLELFARFVADAPFYYHVGTPGAAPRSVAFSEAPAAGELPANPSAVVRLDDSVRVVPLTLAAGRQSHLCLFDPSDAAAPPEVYDGERGAFVALDGLATIPASGRFSKGITAVDHQLSLRYDPSLDTGRLAEVVELSRETGILVADTSYIVVENASQWEILKQTEKKKLANHQALEIDTVPEPSSALLVLLGGAWVLLRRRRGGV